METLSTETTVAVVNDADKEVAFEIQSKVDDLNVLLFNAYEQGVNAKLELLPECPKYKEGETPLCKNQFLSIRLLKIVEIKEGRRS